MLGDGVNDVLALKDADCSIAMAAGSDAAQQVSHLVLLNSNFSALPQVVREGRRVINNIARSASLFLVKNIFSFLASAILLVLPLLYPLRPAQVSLVSGLLIGVPSFLLTFEPSYERIRGHFLRSVFVNALPGGLADVCAIFACVWAGSAMALPMEQISTVCTLLLSLNGFLVLVLLCRPFTPYRGLVLGLILAAFAGAVLLFFPWFQLTPLTRDGWNLLGLLAPPTALVLLGLTFLCRRFRPWLLRLFRSAAHRSAPRPENTL